MTLKYKRTMKEDEAHKDFKTMRKNLGTKSKGETSL